MLRNLYQGLEVLWSRKLSLCFVPFHSLLLSSYSTQIMLLECLASLFIEVFLFLLESSCAAPGSIVCFLFPPNIERDLKLIALLKCEAGSNMSSSDE